LKRTDVLKFCAVAAVRHPGFEFSRDSRKDNEEMMLTSETDFSKIRKFAQNTAARPVSRACEFGKPLRTLPSTNSAIKFEDTNLRLCPELVLDPKLSA
jgi:hypothetical protein